MSTSLHSPGIAHASGEFINQRNELEEIFDESPSLRPVMDEEFHKIYARARREAEIETGLNIFPVDSPFTLEQILHG